MGKIESAHRTSPGTSGCFQAHDVDLLPWAFPGLSWNFLGFQDSSTARWTRGLFAVALPPNHKSRADQLNS